MMGQRIQPGAYHHYARINDKDLKEPDGEAPRARRRRSSTRCPQHADFVRQYAGASPEAWKCKGGAGRHRT
jgi:hypothetical protein